MDELASAGPDSTAIHEHSTTVQPTEQPDPEVMKRKLMASVPKDQQQVFAWPLRWDLLDNAPPDVMQRIEGEFCIWVREYLWESSTFHQLPTYFYQPGLTRGYVPSWGRKRRRFLAFLCSR